jgi:hypothetical protein
MRERKKRNKSLAKKKKPNFHAKKSSSDSFATREHRFAAQV